MLASAEVRWFCRGRPSAAITAWFDRFDPSSESPRTDWYLHPTDAAMNVKWREGQIQAKRRDEPGDVISFATDIHGLVERWRKWSFPLDEEEGADLSQETLWRPVEKSRRMQTYHYDEQGCLVRAEGDIEAGCQVELATLTMEGAPWWSICFESFGAESQLRDLLMTTTRFVFSQGTPPALETAHSEGYAAWLMNNPSECGKE